jgi:hypothetical protein
MITALASDVRRYAKMYKNKRMAFKADANSMDL